MRPLLFGGREPVRVLALGAHSDDIEIGCGGTLLRLLRNPSVCTLRWVVFSACGERQHEARNSACAYLGSLRAADVSLFDHRDGFFPYDGGAIKERFEQLKTQIAPDVVFTHHLHDRHQDHRLVAELTWNTFRDALILEYEIMKWDGDLVTPNVYVQVSTEDATTKVERLMSCFPSQRSRDWFTEDAFLAMLRLRGVESRSASGFAEGFHARKLVLGPAGGDGR